MDHRSERVTALLNAALEREAGERSSFLAAECGQDEELREEVTSLLGAYERAGDFLEKPAAVAGGFVPAPPGRPGTLAGRMLGPYRMERELGRGGMGIVYLAEDTRLGRKVAIKILPPEYAADAARKNRLRLEARAAAALSHPAIATVFSLEELEGRLCLVTEYVRGDTVRSEIQRGPLSLDLVIETGIQVARGLGAAHGAGVVHRDLKPDNVVRNLQGGVKILDFGIARVDTPFDTDRLTGAGMIVGTPGYMAPEQLDGAEVDPRTDIFALGVLLFELATGVHPFAGPTPSATAANVYAANPPLLSAIAPNLPPELDAIVRKCLRRHRTERYATAVDVARDLQDLREGKLRRAAPAGAATGRSSVLWWWRLHQLCAIIVESALVWGVWLAHKTLESDWTLAILLAYIATVAVNGTLRVHLLFTSTYNAAGMQEQFRRATPLVRGTDLVVALLLLIPAAAILRPHTLLSATLAAFGVGWAVVSLMVEPATRAAAFAEGPPSGARQG